MQPALKIVIPARFASTRLPGKPLADIAGKPMIQRVWERAQEAANSGDEIIIAADDDRILSAATAFGAQAIKTRADHETGTDRIAEVAALLKWDDGTIVVNLQGDEPLMPPALIRLMGEALAANPDAAMATASCAIHRAEDVANPNIVKVVTGDQGTALYFSRAAIPHDRTGAANVSAGLYQRHLGLYAYRVSTLRTLANLPPAPLEVLEGLEQLRALDAGMKIHVTEIAEAPPHGVDTEADLAAVRKLVEQAGD
ncbi:MAG: 3-deoxy-manno-octulosonate cytidylyltransferase [Kordiimonadales bacterium]|nr:MAG: 3-deoxy-manno-octulosonate cytidylyltransferase [Kordiimonadales bacterium]